MEKGLSMKEGMLLENDKEKCFMVMESVVLVSVSTEVDKEKRKKF